MNRTKRFFYNSATTAVYQFFVLLAGLIVPRVMLTLYGSEINGLVSSIAQFINYFTIVETGISGASVYALYKPLADNDHKAINGILSATRRFYMRAGFIFLGLMFLLAALYPFFVQTEALGAFDIRLLICILGVNGVLEIFTLAKYRALLNADQRTYVISIAGAVNTVLNTAIIIVLANLGVGIVLLRFAALFSIFARTAILMLYVKRRYGYLDYGEKPDYAAISKRWDALWIQIMEVVLNGAPVVILTLVRGDLKQVSIYTVFNLAIAGVGGILSIFVLGLSASFGDVIVRGEKEVLRRAYSEFELFYYSLITVAYTITYVMIMPFIRLYTAGVTDVNYDLPLVGLLFVINGLLMNMKTPQNMLIVSAGHYRETRPRAMVQTGIAVVLGVALARPLGVVGVMLAVIAANLYRCIDMLLYVPKHITGISPLKTLIRWGRMLICMFIICLPFEYLGISAAGGVEWRASGWGYFQWIKWAVFVGLFGIATVLLFGRLFERTTFYAVVRRFASAIGIKMREKKSKNA